jgi:protein phosphatase
MMSPCETSKEPSLLEHPQEASSYYRHEGVPHVICGQKHMGSRAVVVLCREQRVSQRRFGVLTPSLGGVYTRTGRRFFNEDATEGAFLLRLRDTAESSGLWTELATDWMCLDCD